MAYITGTFNISVKMIGVADAGKAGPADESGTMSTALKAVAAALAGKAGPADESGSWSVTLKPIAVVAAGTKANQATFAVTVKPVAFNGSGLIANGGQVHATLKPVAAHFTGGTIHGVSPMHVTLKPVRAIFSGTLTPKNPPIRLHVFSKRIMADGGAILMFEGKPNVAVVWQITSGGGSIVPLQGAHTDKFGRAYAQLLPGGFSGQVSIQVTYGT